ncbi:uncharacterized protein [Centruroides vittatus]|uniref:uncharacterized protein n=1 Tax=Centruroides vittatus TaxID=120091 RepID=UPI00350EC33C
MSRGRSSQIDFFLCRRRHLSEVRNIKVLNGESVAAQHRVFLVDYDLLMDHFREEISGNTSGKKLPEGKELWWWNAEVQAAVKQKKDAKKRWDLMGGLEDKETYHLANKMTKKAVAIAKAKALEEAYKVLERKGGERQLMRIAKARDKATKDFTCIKLIKDDKGVKEGLGSNLRLKSLEQFGFLPGRSTTDAIFALKQLMERHREMHKDLHMVFIDLKKAYDRVPRQEVWSCLREKNVPEKYVRLVKEMYEGAETQVKSSVGTTEGLFVNVGLHHGSAFSPYLFDLIMDVFGV